MKTKIQTHLKNSTLMLGALAAVSTVQGSADYGPAIWNPIPNNYYTSGLGHRFLVIHDMEGFYGSVRNVLIGAGVSVHYAVNSGSGTSSGGYTDSDGKPPGEISQFVSEAYYAWDAACWNQYHIGTEHEGFASNPAWYTEAQYVASAGLQRHLCDAWGIAKDRNHIVGHGEKSNAAWASWAGSALGINAYCNTHTDPGPYWDWNHFMALINPPPPTPWSPMQSLGGQFTSRFTSCSWGANRLDVFGRGIDNNIWHRWWDSVQWQPVGGWEAHVFNAASAPAAACWGANRMDVFALGTDGACWRHFWNGTSWSGWASIGKPPGLNLIYSPAVCSWGANRLDIFAVGSDHIIYHTWCTDGVTWNAWQNLGGYATSEPAACCWGVNRIDVFVRGGDNQLYHKYWNVNAWLPGATTWEVPYAGTSLQYGPGCSSWGSGRLDVFNVGFDNNTYHDWFDGGWWYTAELHPTLATSGPSCTSWAPWRLDMFVRGSDNACWTQHYPN